MSKYPSLEEFDENLVSETTNNDSASGFEHDNFLDREKAVLGDDAAVFEQESQSATAQFESSFPAIEDPVS